jgi:hypothetical protein
MLLTTNGDGRSRDSSRRRRSFHGRSIRDAPVMQEVEHHQGDRHRRHQFRSGPPHVHPRLQSLEGGSPRRVEGDDLAVEYDVGRDPVGQFRIPGLDPVPVPGPDRPVSGCHRPHAVPLDLVRPSRLVGDGGPTRGQHRRVDGQHPPTLCGIRGCRAPPARVRAPRTAPGSCRPRSRGSRVVRSPRRTSSAGPAPSS